MRAHIHHRRASEGINVTLSPAAPTTVVAHARDVSGSRSPGNHTGAFHLRDHEPREHQGRSELKTRVHDCSRSVATHLNSSLRQGNDPPKPRMGTKRRREPSTDPTLILERLHIGLRVISLKDNIRQVQRRVILLRLRKASAEGTLERIVQTCHGCVEHAHSPALPRAF